MRDLLGVHGDGGNRTRARFPPKTASVSGEAEAERYRYTLRREIPGLGFEGTVLFVMLNPSTADDNVDDPTIRRCVSFATRWGFARLEVGNLYALRSTDPASLFASDDPVGRDNDRHLEAMAGRATEIIVAWGATRHPFPKRAQDVLRRLEFHCRANCLGQTKQLHPRHPLYVRGDKHREVFKRLAVRV